MIIWVCALTFFFCDLSFSLSFSFWSYIIRANKNRNKSNYIFSKPSTFFSLRIRKHYRAQFFMLILCRHRKLSSLKGWIRSFILHLILCEGALTSSTPTATPVWSRRCAHTNLAMSTLVWPVGVELVRTLLSMLGDACGNFIKHNIRAARVSFCVISTLLEGCWVFYYGSWPQKFRCTTHSARFGFTTVIFYNVLTNHELYFSVQKDMTILYLSIILKASFSEGFLASQNKECLHCSAKQPGSISHECWITLGCPGAFYACVFCGSTMTPTWWRGTMLSLLPTIFIGMGVLCYWML